MPLVDLIDECFIVAPRAEVAAVVRDSHFWSLLWPGLELTVAEDRADEGIRWTCAGVLSGSAEVWLEEFGDGVIVHCYLRAEPPPGWSGGRIRRESRRRELQVKQVMFSLKGLLEGDRPPGTGRVTGRVT